MTRFFTKIYHVFTSIILVTPLVATPDFLKDVQPILEENCIRCHGENKDKGGLQMHTHALMMEGGETGDAIDLKNPERSLILELVSLSHDHDDIMPPAPAEDDDADYKGGFPLSDDQIGLLDAWIRNGAKWPVGVSLTEKEKSRRESDLGELDPELMAIEVFPKQVSLETSADFHRFVVVAHYKDTSTRDVTPSIDLQVVGQPVVRVEDTTLFPEMDGSCLIQISYRGKQLSVPVTVKEASENRLASFQRDVMPVLTASGCNTGSCHGSARGRDGFMLSLFGYDPVGDYHRITREMPGRRINLALPEDSLLLRKAIEAVPHTGGKLFEKDSRAYQVLLDWVKAGADYDEPQDNGIVLPTAIEVYPKQVVLKGKDQLLPLSVRAIYSDGSDRDVTKLTTFSTSNDNSVKVDSRSGLMSSSERGEAFVMGRFHTFSEGMHTIVVPKDNLYQRPKLEEANYIDELVHEKLHRLRVTPSELCDDSVFIRRVHLDLIGRLPTPGELDSFLKDSNPLKRNVLVDRLIDTNEFTEIWVMKWAELLQIRTFPNQVSYKAALLYP
jgi:hypothetical protein